MNQEEMEKTITLNRIRRKLCYFISKRERKRLKRALKSLEKKYEKKWLIKE